MFLHFEAKLIPREPHCESVQCCYLCVDMCHEIGSMESVFLSKGIILQFHFDKSLVNDSKHGPPIILVLVNQIKQKWGLNAGSNLPSTRARCQDDKSFTNSLK